MDSSGSNQVDIFEVYSRYCDIVLKSEYASSREALDLLSRLVESRRQRSDKNRIFDDLFELMARLNLTVNSRQFACFYDFVFFICRENGQKNITVSRAIAAWRLVLTGRFRLLNQWCDFVEKNQRHNVSEDTWRQLLAFSRCVHEDLEGYDPKGAWPVLIDDFVDHMYRITRSNCCSTQNCCKCDDPDTQPCTLDTLPGLKVLPASKRKSLMVVGRCNLEEPNSFQNSTGSMDCLTSKRSRQASITDQLAYWDLDFPVNAANVIDDHMEMNPHSTIGCLNNSACAVEGILSKGFEGLLSTEFDQKRRISYT